MTDAFWLLIGLLLVAAGVFYFTRGRSMPKGTGERPSKIDVPPRRED